MGDFRQGGGSRFGGSFGGRGGRPSGGKSWGGKGGNFSRGPVTMHKVVCDECKKPCEVPFLPTAGKPVYCNTCFGGKKEVGGDNRGFTNKSSGDYKTPPRIDFGANINKVSGEEIKKQIEVLNTKIDRLTKVIEGLVSPRVGFSEVKKAEAKVETVEVPSSVKPAKASVKKTVASKVKKIIKKVSKK